jgi:hypothetical protein
MTDEPSAPHPWRRQRRGVKAVAALSVIILLFDLNRDAERCEQDCYGTYRTYEAGHAWTNYPDSWQWDAQNAIAGVAFIVGVASYVFLLADRRLRAAAFAVASLVMIAAWLTWVTLSPARG